MHAAASVPLIGMVTRLTRQKGIDLLPEVLPRLLQERDFRFVALGSGEAQYERFMHELQQRFPGRVVFYSGYSEELAHFIEAAADMFLMPSLYEPCGLNQMYSLKYGTVPVVRRTGGLADSVQHFDPATGQGTGIVFNDFDAGWPALGAADRARVVRLAERVAPAGAERHAAGLLVGRAHRRVRAALRAARKGIGDGGWG